MTDNERRRVQKERRELLRLLKLVDKELERRGIAIYDIYELEPFIDILGTLGFTCPLHPDANPDDQDQFDWDRNTGCRQCARALRGPRKPRTQSARVRVAIETVETEKAPATEAVEAEELTPPEGLPGWQKMGM